MYNIVAYQVLIILKNSFNFFFRTDTFRSRNSVRSDSSANIVNMDPRKIFKDVPKKKD